MLTPDPAFPPPPAEARLGFCCKFVPPDGDAERVRAMNMMGTTMAYLGRLGDGAFDKVAAVVAHNLGVLRRQIEHVAARPPLERLLRTESSILPAYNHAVFNVFYQDPDLRGLIERELAAAGEEARAGGVRMSMHPDQFCVIASANGAALENGIREFEYHARVMEMMGYGDGWHPDGAHINIHGGARAHGAEGFRAGLARLSQTARNLITVENDEVSYSFDSLLPLADSLPIVLDLHHHWVASGGEYIEPDDPRIAIVQESWRGTRPLSHVSVGREALLASVDPTALPDFAALVATGVKPRDLRGHSDMMWNLAVNDLVGRHLSWSDFEIEAKLKNLASEQIARHVAGLPPLVAADVEAAAALHLAAE